MGMGRNFDNEGKEGDNFPYLTPYYACSGVSGTAVRHGDVRQSAVMAVCEGEYT